MKFGVNLKNLGLALLFISVGTGCVSFGGRVGIPTPEQIAEINWGKPATKKVCILRDTDVPMEQVGKLMDIYRQKLNLYGINLEIPWVRDFERPEDIVKSITELRLERPCHRAIMMIGRNAGDAAYGVISFITLIAIGILPPDEFGGVDLLTGTVGYVVATSTFSLAQLLVGGPEGSLEEEIYHFFGCVHGDSESCVKRIKRLKDLAAVSEEGFFPSMPPVEFPSGIFTSLEMRDRVVEYRNTCMAKEVAHRGALTSAFNVEIGMGMGQSQFNEAVYKNCLKEEMWRRIRESKDQKK